MNDHTSVYAWVEQLKSSPITLSSCSSYMESHNQKTWIMLEKMTLYLKYQTQFQCDMLVKHGHRCVCMDATHGSNSNSACIR